MGNKQNLNLTKHDVLAFGFASLVLFLFYFSRFYNLERVVLFFGLSLIGLFGIAIVLKYKQSLLFALSFFIPLSVSVNLGGSEIGVPSELICILLSLFFIAKIITGTKIQKSFLSHPITILVIADLCWLFVTSCTSEMPMVSFKRLAVKLLYYITFYYFYYELFLLDIKNIKRVFLLHCLGLLIPAVRAITSHAVLNFSTMKFEALSKPFYNDHTMYGTVLVFFIPFLFINIFSEQKNKLKTLYAALFVVFCAAAYLSYSRAAWLSLAVTITAACFIYFNVKAKYVLALALIGGMIVFSNSDLIKNFSQNKELSHSKDITEHFKSISNVNSDASNRERINRWKCAVRMFKDKPVFGFGPGTYQFFYGQYQVRNEMTRISTYNGTKGHAHSEYLNYLSETGIFGLIIFSLMVFFVISMALNIYKRTKDKQIKNTAFYLLLGLISFYTHGFFNGFIEFDKLAMPVFSSMAAIVYLDNVTQNKWTQ